MIWNTFEIDGISYKVAGSGPALICLSGFACSDWNYEFLKEKLVNSFRLVLIDNRGMGNSSLSQSDYEMKDLAKDVLKVADALHLSSFHLMGVSMGGFIAIEFAIMACDRLDSLILGCTLGGGERFEKITRLTEEAIIKSREIEPRIRESFILSQTIHPDFFGTDIFNKILKLRVSNIASLEEVKRQIKAVNHFLDSEQNFENIKCKTLILSGDSDRFVPVRASYKLNALIRHSSLKLIAKSDHHFFLERAQEVAMEIQSFIFGEKNEYHLA